MTRETVRHVAGWGAAVAMLPYFVIKIFWTIDGLRGGGLHDGAWSTLNWAAINGMTVALAGVAILLGLALAQRWGLRLPGGLLLFPAWIGGGFLVPMIPLVPFLMLLTTGSTDAAGTSSMPDLEVALISLSFGGFALGVAIAFPLYVLRRWPDAFTGRAPAASTSPVTRTAAALSAAVAVVIGVPQLFWALGGTVGLDQAHLAARDTQWHLLTGNNGLWALIAAWGVWTVAYRGTGGRRMLVTWVASGFLFAWGSWKAALAFATTAGFPPPEHPVVLSLQNHFGALAGLAILLVLLLRLTPAGPGAAGASAGGPAPARPTTSAAP